MHFALNGRVDQYNIHALASLDYKVRRRSGYAILFLDEEAMVEFDERGVYRRSTYEGVLGEAEHMHI